MAKTVQDANEGERAVHETLRRVVRSWGQRELECQAGDYDARGSFNRTLFQRLGTELGLLGVTVDVAHGGAGQDGLSTLIVIEELSRFDPGFVLSYLAHEVLFVHHLWSLSREAPHVALLKRAMSGEWLCGMAMSEPCCGTDVLGMQTRAVRRGDHFVLNGTKQWITNGPNGDAFLVYARSGEGPRDISLFIVERGFRGLSVGRAEEKLGMRASVTGSLYLSECEVPADHLVGSLNGALPGMMRNLAFERLALAAQSCGIASRCVEEMTQYAVCERQAFGEHLVAFGQIQRLLAESYAHTEAARGMVYGVAGRLEAGTAQPAEADAAKLFATGVGESVSRNAIQVLGGMGYSRNRPVERLHRDAILLSIGGGTNEALQKNIARALARRCRS